MTGSQRGRPPRHEKYLKYLFVGPAIIYLLALLLFPAMFNLYASFNRWLPTGGTPSPVFIGFANYANLLRDSRFLDSLAFTLGFVTATVSIEVLLGFGLALAATRIPRGRTFFTVTFMLPIMMAPIAVGYIWRMLYHADYGVIPNLLMNLGFPRVYVLTERAFAFWGLVLIDTWEWTPFVFLVMLAALASLPREPFEAALIDGAGTLDVFRFITLPLVLPVLLTISLLRMVESFKVFDIIYITTGGAVRTESVSVYLYRQGIKSLDLGYSGAIAWIFFIVVMIITVLFILSLRRVMRF